MSIQGLHTSITKVASIGQQLSMSMAFAVYILVVAAAQLQATEALTLDRSTIAPVVTEGGSSGTCPSIEARQTTIERIQNDIKGRIPVTNSECGEGLWYRIAYFDMKDSAQKCPSAWREYTSSSVRVCGRPTTTSGSCPATSYIAGRPYTKVCGRVIGYQVSSPDGVFSNTIDQAYVDGVSVTYGNPRNHIWTFAVGVTENSFFHFPNNCPCWDSSAKQPPSFVGNNYFCESGNPSSNFVPGFLYNSDKLWDGQQCSGEGTCCTGPPWFSVELPNNSTDDIEVRICGNEGTNNEDTPIELMEIYIQ